MYGLKDLKSKIEIDANSVSVQLKAVLLKLFDKGKHLNESKNINAVLIKFIFLPRLLRTKLRKKSFVA